jgi:SOUL heme-binding protein
MSPEPSEKIAMTAPVIQQPNRNLWTVRFVMPSSYSMKTLPKPNNQGVSLRELPERRFAVIRFSGLADRETLLKQTEELKLFVRSKKLTVASEPAYAFFNPPWTLPFLRRNEVMLEVAR